VQQGAQSINNPPHPSGCGWHDSLSQRTGVQHGAQLSVPPHPSGCCPHVSLPQVNGVQVPDPAQKIAHASPLSAALSPSWNMT
jgi:hypothetical protein